MSRDLLDAAFELDRRRGLNVVDPLTAESPEKGSSLGAPQSDTLQQRSRNVAGWMLDALFEQCAISSPEVRRQLLRAAGTILIEQMSAEEKKALVRELARPALK